MAAHIAGSRENAMLERLKKQLKDIEYEEKRLHTELERKTSEKRKVLQEMSKFSDEKREEDILAQVFQQRRAERASKK